LSFVPGTFTAEVFQSTVQRRLVDLANQNHTHQHHPPPTSTMLNFWQATLTTNSPSVSWKKRPTESLLHVTMVCFSKFNNTSTTPTSAPTFVQATLPDSAVPITICVLRQGVTDNQCVELFFDQSVTFSASGPHDIQLCGQIASASSSPSLHQTTRPTRTATSAKDSKQSSSDSDNDLDYQPGLDTGFGNSSSPSESDSESDHEALGKVLARDVVGGKRKANANVAAASQDKAKKPKNNKGSDSSGSSSSDSDSDSDSEDDANDNTQSVTPQNKQGSKASISEKLLQTLKSMNKARSGASSADIGTKYRDLHGKGFKEDASMKLMKFVKENGELFELTPGNLVKSASA